jgi:hypothetical protein
VSCESSQPISTDLAQKILASLGRNKDVIIVIRMRC